MRSQDKTVSQNLLKHRIPRDGYVVNTKEIFSNSSKLTWLRERIKTHNSRADKREKKEQVI